MVFLQSYFWNYGIVLDHFFEILSTLSTGSFHRDQNTSLISVLYTKGKSPLICGSYRPISLITTELKVFAKLLAKRLEPSASKLINFDLIMLDIFCTLSMHLKRILHLQPFLL